MSYPARAEGLVNMIIEQLTTFQVERIILIISIRYYDFYQIMNPQLFAPMCYVLTFWPGQKCHSRWCTGRKWHILRAVMRGNRVGCNWLMKWDKVKKIYSHKLTHHKRVTSELHDSYFRSITITQAIPKIAEVTHPDRQISEEIAEAWRRGGVSISPRGSLKVI